MGDTKLLTAEKKPRGSKNSIGRLEISEGFLSSDTNLILSSGRRIFDELSNAVKSCESIESLGSLAKLFSFVFDRETRESLWNIGGETKRILYQPISTLVVQYQSWVLDCVELFHEMNITNDNRVEVFMKIFQDIRSNVSNLYQILTIFERQLKIVQSLLDSPPTSFVEDARKTISQKSVLGYIIACIILDIICIPFIGFGIIGLVSVEVSILLGFPSLLQFITRRKQMDTRTVEVKQ
ncbi:MAG: hypothetical protein ACFFEV_00300 [Candidatus Thorarchaeota archaeon]